MKTASYLFTLTNGMAYLVEVKAYLKAMDVLAFYRKVKFAEGKLGRPLIPLIIALSMHPTAEQRLRKLGVHYRVGAGG
jgi:predicted RecB family endonuclease